jgi:hypothetical protein
MNSLGHRHAALPGATDAAVIGTLTPHPRELHSQDRRKRAGDDLSTGLADHEADRRDELPIAPNDGLIPVHEFIGVERKRQGLDLVPAIPEQDVLDFIDLNSKRHGRTSGVANLKEKRPPQKAEASSSFTVIVTRKTNELFVPRRDRRWPGWVLKLGQALDR